MEELQNKVLNPDNNSFTLKKVISRSIRFWYLYLLSLTICVGYAWFKVHYATPMYKVNAEVLIKDDKNGGGSSQALSGSGGGMDFNSLFSGKTNIQNEISIIQTTDLCRQVVYDLHLYIGYYHKGKVRAVELYNNSPFKVAYHPNNDTIMPILMELKFPKDYTNNFTISIGNRIIHWHFNDTLHFNNGSYYFTNNGGGFDADASYMLSIQNPEAIALGLAANLNVDMLTAKGTILNLTYNTNLPGKGVDVLNGVIRVYINRNLEEKNQTSDSAIQFINERIALVGGELGAIESTIQQFKQTNKITDLEAQSQQLVANSSSNYQQLNTLEIQLQVLKTMLAYVQDEQNNRRPVPALLNADPTFSALVAAYNAAQVQRDRLLLSVKEGNPLANNLDVQIAGLRGDVIRSLKSQQEALSISQQKVNNQNNDVNNLIQNVPLQERKFLDYSREQSVKQGLYLFLLQRREEIAIAKASNTPNASIIQAPQVNYMPYEPNVSTTFILGTLSGFGLPIAFVVLSILLNNKILSKDDITDVTSATILGEVGHSSHEGLLNIEEEGRSIIAEQFRIFRTNMDFALPSIKAPVILITSGISGEGKSFIAGNLGQIYAISGKKVLLIELDLRKPKLSKMLQVNNEVGFSNFIVSDKPVQNFIQPVNAAIPTLFLLPSGPIPPNPAELLMSKKVTEMITELKQHFDVILIDTAPVGAVTDAQIIGKFADVSLYIVRQQYSLKNSLEIVNDILVNTKLPSFYLVINDVKEVASYRYGYRYGYKYGYGYGYTDKVKKAKTSWWKRK